MSKVLYHTNDLGIEWLATELTRHFEQEGYQTEQSSSENTIQIQLQDGVLIERTDVTITLQGTGDGLLVEIDRTPRGIPPVHGRRRRLAQDAASTIDEIIRQRLPNVQIDVLEKEHFF